MQARRILSLGLSLVLVNPSCRNRSGAGSFSSAEDSNTGTVALGLGLSNGDTEETKVDQQQNRPWISAAACERSWAARGSVNAHGRARVASWNVRFFPDSTPQMDAQPHTGTDVAWLSCALAHLEAPVIAVQEFRRHPRAERAAAELIQSLDRRTSGRWRLVLDRCEGEPEQTHVGFLFDEARVSAHSFENIDNLNPLGGCSRGLHPGFSALFRFPGGLDLEIVVVHLIWGKTRESAELRRRAWTSLQRIRGRDSDVIVLGDFNTEGCGDCDPAVSGAEELADLSQASEAAEPGLQLVSADLGCTQYEQSVPHTLDHVLVTRSTAELPKNASVHVTGICPQLGCQPLNETWNAFQRDLSDHCPITLDLHDQDEDPSAGRSN